ncbi:MAG: hypothetical protein COV66_04985 [Nitrospinae bacterium CG11_big_fil_rev_8_21_14_0_20_45_15]|nr:MAG: hypothetical protein COV66_04985 [Nitrospinae bacterium CG11_big_fil_rev_8_21_14_0_20_45_15]
MKKILIVLLLIGLGVLSSCTPPKPAPKMPQLFYLGYAMEAGAGPSFMISKDFNKDGNLDLIVTNSGDHTFSYFKGRGDGRFDDQIVFRTGQDPICITTGLFNADAYLDLAVVNYADQSIQIYLNTKTGSFRNTGQIIHPGKIPINIAAGDFNTDGMDDLAVSMRYHKVNILLAQGNGKFSEPVEVPVRGQPTGVVVGDYNRDKKMDVGVALAGSGNTGVQVLWGKGDGTFDASKLYKGGGQPLTIVALDSNNDGYGDFVTSSNVLHSMTSVVSDGSGGFTTWKDFASGNFPKFVAAADFTGDGKDDLVVSNATDDKISISLGRGDGTFTYPPIYHSTDEYPQGLATGDFNKDGLIDIAVACRDKNIIDIFLKKDMVNPKTEPMKKS